MIDLFNKVLANVHYLILAFSLWNFYGVYEEHNVAVSGIEAQLVQIEEERKVTEKSVSEIQDNLGRINEFKVRVEEVAKNIEAVQKQLPADINDAQILTFLNQELSLLNVKDTSLVPGSEVPSTYYITKDFNLRGNGTFLQFLIFFERLGNADRIYNVKSLKMVNNNESHKGRFQIVAAESVIQAFRYNPDFKVDLGFEKTGTQVNE